MKACLVVLLVALAAVTVAAEQRPLGRLLRQATGGFQMSTASADGSGSGENSIARTTASASASGDTFNGVSTGEADAINGEREGRARAQTSQMGFASNTRTGSFAVANGVQIASGTKDALAYGTAVTGVSGSLSLAEAFGGAEANNYPASFGYGSYGDDKKKKWTLKKEEREFVQEPAEAFVLTNSWAVNGRN